MKTKNWIIIGVVAVVVLLIAYAIKVTLDKQAEEQKKILYQNQLNNLNIPKETKPPFLNQVFSTFISLYGLGI